MSSWPEFGKCVNCEKEKKIKYLYECTHCNKDVCRLTSCCNVFPRADNEDIVICHDCQNKIEEKFVLVMDFNKLNLLKGKIKNNTTRAKVI
jgi:hypothetical protein